MYLSQGKYTKKNNFFYGAFRGTFRDSTLSFPVVERAPFLKSGEEKWLASF